MLEALTIVVKALVSSYGALQSFGDKRRERLAVLCDAIAAKGYDIENMPCPPCPDQGACGDQRCDGQKLGIHIIEIGKASPLHDGKIIGVYQARQKRM